MAGSSGCRGGTATDLRESGPGVAGAAGLEKCLWSRLLVQAASFPSHPKWQQGFGPKAFPDDRRDLAPIPGTLTDSMRNPARTMTRPGRHAALFRTVAGCSCRRNGSAIDSLDTVFSYEGSR